MHSCNNRSTGIAAVGKRVGETPLMALERYRAVQQIPARIPIAYAGRLDPMASGTLLLLLGEECKQQALYHKLDKAYRFSICFGCASDTGDILGRLLPYSRTAKLPTETQLERLARSVSGTTLSLPYPQYSSKPVQGKPLFRWALEDRLDEVTIPTRSMHVYRFSLERVRTRTLTQLAHFARVKIDTLPKTTEPSKALGADFRRDAVQADWARLAASAPETRVTIAAFRAVVQSGTYIRALAPYLGELLHTPALATHIHRTTVGRFLTLHRSWGVWRTSITHRERVDEWTPF